MKRRQKHREATATPDSAARPWNVRELPGATRATFLAGRTPETGIVVRTGAEHGDLRVVVAFAPDSAPTLPIGRPVELAFEGGHLEATCDANGQVTERSEEFGAVFYEVLFPRVPDPEAPLRVELRACDDAVRLDLEALDVSASGLSLPVPLELEARLSRTWEVDLTLHLPGDPIPRHVPARILRRTLSGGFVRYALHFREQGTAGEREALLQWVLARHRAELSFRRES